MSQTIYRIDPNADTVIVLTNPLVEFAVWNPQEAEVNIEEPDEPPPDEPADDEGEPIDEEILYFVSSRHLALASSWFAKVFDGDNWRESLRDGTDGLFHVNVEGWDVHALLYLLNILHHRNREVPRQITLEMFAKVAVLVDYYECAEAIEMYAERWTEYLEKASPIPKIFDRNLMLWLCIAWVCKLPDQFRRATEVAIRRADQELKTLGLPVTRCADNIELARQQAIDLVLTKLHDLRQSYRDSGYKCITSSEDSFLCGSMLYGALTKELDRMGLLPRPAKPFPDLNLWELQSKVKGIACTDWSRPYRHYTHQMCDLNTKVGEIVDNAIVNARGLDLKDFQSN
ncbi:hypothetical protein IQ07DRAFT_588915 [Pyrenochaeta sp. DS3sAY3a]|nr:hypothetical protein IQ07DRAFT_588915 [Pyrenochaeta sp. DS3sAY3a]